jgi:hypothetical protein
MICSEQEMKATQELIRRFEAQIGHSGKIETNPTKYRLSVAGYCAEIDRMQLEVREYLSAPAAGTSASR